MGAVVAWALASYSHPPRASLCGHPSCPSLTRTLHIGLTMIFEHAQVQRRYTLVHHAGLHCQPNNNKREVGPLFSAVRSWSAMPTGQWHKALAIPWPGATGCIKGCPNTVVSMPLRKDRLQGSSKRHRSSLPRGRGPWPGAVC